MGGRVPRVVDQAILSGVAVYATGGVLAGARDQVQARVARILAGLPGCWSSARVRLTTIQHRGLPWAALAQANLEFQGHPIRAQVTARFSTEASQLRVERLAEQLDRLANPTQLWPSTAPRPEPVPRPAAARRTVRTKRYPLTRCAPERAALLMDIGDHDFYLFTDTTATGAAASSGGGGGAGVDAVIYRVGPTGYRLARFGGLVPPLPNTTLPITSGVHAVPRCTLAQAAAQLAATELRFLLFRHRH